MEDLALIGVSHKRGGAQALEHYQKTFSNESLVKLGFKEYVPIATCNRWDIVVALPQGMELSQVRQHLTDTSQSCKPYAYFADGALEQLTRIAASLESLNPGEDQIIKQVREAFKIAKASGTVGSTTTFAFDTALRIAKKIRHEVAIAPMDTSLFSLARPILENELPQSACVAVLGVGEMGKLAAKTLTALKKTLIIVNRSLEKAQKLAEQLNAKAMSLDDFLVHPPDVQALVCATPVKDLITLDLVRRLNNLHILVDLGIPRNIQKSVGEHYTVLDVDTLQIAGEKRRQEIRLKLAKAEKILLEQLDLAFSEWTERQLGPSIKKLRELYIDTIGESLPPEKAQQLAHKFVHIPIKGLKAVAREYGLAAAKTFLNEVELLSEV